MLSLLQSLRRLVVLCLMLLCATQARAADFLEPDAAFHFSARMQDGGTIAVTYRIADGYYMYRERFKFEAVGAVLGQPEIPPGTVKFDTTFQKNEETYRHALTITIPVQASGAFTLVASAQGCSDQGLCYAPQEARASLVGAAAADTSTPAAAGVAEASPGRIEAALASGRLLLIAPLFIVLGLGLAFTPCVLPLLPILSCIIVGEGERVSRKRGLLLSATYALGMALVYTALGVAAGLAGEGLAASLQNRWVLGAFALLMAGLSLSMFGLYQLQVPAALQEKLTALSNRQSSGKLAGVFAMGAISALIVGPCVAAPLAGILLYISQTRDAVTGGGALFALSVGMSLPLLLLGASAGALLPRAGLWMDQIKRIFGVLMLATAWWLLAPVLPATVQMAGWAALGIGCGMYLLSASKHWLVKACALLLAVLGVLQLAGVSNSGRQVLAQLRGESVAALPFTRVKTVAQLDALLAQTQGKTVLLDFYADWCVACKEMERQTLTLPAVRGALAKSILLQADVTANDADDKAMLKRFSLFGPPAIILFDGAGQEIIGARVIGYQDGPTFLQSLTKLR